MQRAESAVAGDRVTGTIRMAFERLLEVQEREIKCLEENGARKLAVLEADRDRKLLANANLRSQLQERQSWPKRPVRPVVTVPHIGGKRARTAVTALFSGRTRGRYTAYKVAAQTVRLNVQIGDIGEITKGLLPCREGKSGRGSHARL
jgi:hypothetical protein